MSQMDLDSFLTTTASIAQGALQGRAQAQQENDEDQRQQQQLALQAFQTASGAAAQQRQDITAAYSPILTNLQRLTPGSQGAALGEYGQQQGAVPRPSVGALAGAFDADSPAAKILKAFGGAGGAVRPPSAGYYPYGLPQPVPGVPGAPGMAQTAGMAPGGPAGLTSFTSPGGQPLTFQGVTDKDRALQGGRLDRAAAAFKGHTLPPELRSQVDAGLATARQALAAAQTPEEFAAAKARVDEIEGFVAQVPAAERSSLGNTAKTNAARYDRMVQQFGTKGRTGAGAYADILQLEDLEGQQEALAAKDPSLAVPGMDRLAPYREQIQGMKQQFEQAQALRQKKERTPQEEAQLKDLDRGWQAASQELRDMFRYNIDPSKRGPVISGMLSLIRSLPLNQRSPDNVARLLERSDPQLAALVRERGLQIGGADAEKQTQGLERELSTLMKQGAPEPVLRDLADRVGVASTLAGHPVSLSRDDLTPKDASDQPGTTKYYQKQKTILELNRLRAQNAAEIKDGKWQGYLWDLDVKKAKADQATGRLPDPSVAKSILVKRLSQAQHDADQAFTLYNNYVRTNPMIDKSTFDPEAWLKTHRPGDYAGLDADTAKAVRLYVSYRDKVNAQSALFDKYGAQAKKELPAATATAPGTTAARRPAATAAAAPRAAADRDRPRQVTIGGRQITTTPAQAWQALQQRVRMGRITAAQANQTMTDLFGAR